MKEWPESFKQLSNIHISQFYSHNCSTLLLSNLKNPTQHVLLVFAAVYLRSLGGYGGTSKDIGGLLAAAGCCSAHPTGASAPSAALEGVATVKTTLGAMGTISGSLGHELAINWGEIEVGPQFSYV